MSYLNEDQELRRLCLNQSYKLIFEPVFEHEVSPGYH